MSSNFENWDVRCKVYIGGLGEAGSKSEIEETFNKFGHLKHVWIARKPPGFAFVEFADERDALDAVSALDGTRIGGMRVKVQMSRGQRDGDRGGRRRGDQDRDRYDGGHGNDGGHRRTYQDSGSQDSYSAAAASPGVGQSRRRRSLARSRSESCSPPPPKRRHSRNDSLSPAARPAPGPKSPNRNKKSGGSGAAAGRRSRSRSPADKGGHGRRRR